MISQSARLVRWLIVAFAMFVLAGCASQDFPSRPAVDSGADRAVAVALQQVGVPYRYGGASPSGFDCSGLVHYAYARVGKNVPRTTATLWSGLQPIDDSDIRTGDVLFFRIDGKMSHVGMYIGNNEFVHAPSSGRVVEIESLRSDFYERAFIRAGRPY